MNKPLPESVKKWLETTFVYSEYGAGAELLIANPDGEDWEFADFESHLDAEAFLELMGWLKAEAANEQPPEPATIYCEHYVCGRVPLVWQVPFGNSRLLLCQECVDRLVGAVVRNLLGEITASQLFTLMAAGPEATADPLAQAQAEHWKGIANRLIVEVVMLEGVIGHIVEMVERSPENMTTNTLLNIRQMARQVTRELARTRASK